MDEERLNAVETRLSAIEKSLGELRGGMALALGLLETDQGNDLAKMWKRTGGNKKEVSVTTEEWDDKIREMVKFGLELITVHAQDAVKSLKRT